MSYINRANRFELFKKLLKEQQQSEQFEDNINYYSYETQKEKHALLTKQFTEEHQLREKYSIGNFLLKIISTDYKSKSITLKVYETINNQISIINFSKDKRFKDNILFSKYRNNFGTDLCQISVEDFDNIKYTLENIEEYLLFG